jgi:hypothetical protein
LIVSDRKHRKLLTRLGRARLLAVPLEIENDAGFSA